MVFGSIYYHQMSAIKKSITLPKALDSYVVKRARRSAKRRGKSEINYSEALAELIIEARNQVLRKAA